MTQWMLERTSAHCSKIDKFGLVIRNMVVIEFKNKHGDHLAKYEKLGQVPKTGGRAYNIIVTQQTSWKNKESIKYIV